MGVVKNLMVRVGADIRAFRSGFKDAANVTSSVSQKINKHSTGIKKTIGSSFASAVTSVKGHMAAVSKTKEDYATATQNADRLADKIQELQSVYDTVKEATKGLDLSKPLEELMVDAEKTLTQVESKRKKVEAELKSLSGSPKAAGSKKMASLQAELDALSVKSKFAEARLADLDRVADAVGSANMGHASAAGLKKLESQIQSTKNELSTTKIRTEELGAKLKKLGLMPTLGRAIKNIGTAAAHAAGSGVGKLWQKLKGIGGSAVRGIISLPSKLRNIGSSASSSCGGLSKMVRSIRNIGIVSLGMRVASGLFGRLRSVISSYVSQNEELNSTVESLKNQLGAALAPAINVVIATIQKLMPLITAVSNGINSVLTALFGDMLKTTSGIKKAVDEANNLEIHGFDQITKASEDSSESSDAASSPSTDTGAQSGLVAKLTGWIEKLKSAFQSGDWGALGSHIGDGINSAFAWIESLDIGKKLGNFTNTVTTTLQGLFATVDFWEVGQSLAEELDRFFNETHWDKVGDTFASIMTMLPRTLVGFIENTDMEVVALSLSEALITAMDGITDWIQSVNWGAIGDQIATFLATIDWAGIATSIFELLGSALGAAVATIWGAIDGAIAAIGSYFSDKIEESGGNIIAGLWNGIIEAFSNVGQWIKENIFDPFINGFKRAFGIHSPSTIMQDQGGFIMSGLLNGLTNAFANIKQFFSDMVVSIKSFFTNLPAWFKSTFTSAWTSIKNVFSGWGSFFSGLWDKIKSTFSKLGTSIGGAISDAVKSGINGVLSMIENTINKGVGIINGAIGLINKIPGVSVPTIAKVSLPRLARGGIAYGATTAIIGEAGKEAVLPLERNTEWMDTLAKRLLVQGGNGSAVPVILQIILGNRKLTEYFIKDINQITRENGVCPIHV